MIKNYWQKINNKYKFLIIIIIIYILTFILNSKIALNSFDSFCNLGYKILPTLFLVFILIFLFNYFLDTKIIKKYISKKSGWKEHLIVMLIGILSSGPIYMWYPLLADLKEKGMDNSLITSFLYNRSIKPALIPLMIYYFGLPFVIIITGLIMVFSLINGFVLEKILNNK